jgi:hypothetical protein
MWRLARLAAQDAHEKRDGFGAAPAASLAGHVGPGHGRRRAFGSRDREHGRDTEVADTDRDTPRRDPATGDTAHDPAPGDTVREPAPGDTAHDPARNYRACDGRYGTRSGTGRYGTQRPFLPNDGAVARWCDCPVVRLPYNVLLCPMMPGYARLCPVMSGYVRLPGLFGTVCRRGVIGSFVRHEP